MAKMFAHEPIGRPPLQRLCEWDENQGKWIVKESPGPGAHAGEPCRMDHPIGKVKDSIDRHREAMQDDIVEAMARARGGMGMPTIGGAGIAGMMNPYQHGVGPEAAEEDDVAESYTSGPGRVFQMHDGARIEPIIVTTTITSEGISVQMGDKGYDVPAVTEDAVYVMNILPDLLKNFLLKNAQYARAQTGHDLGIKGVIPDINRKSAAIITRVWDADNAWDGQATDSTQELAGDLIGHLLLLLAKMRDA